MHSSDPVELTVGRGLRRADVVFIHESEDRKRTAGLDFYLPELDLYIEVARFHTPRKIEQLGRVPNVVYIQGLEAAESFVRLLAKPAVGQPATAKTSEETPGL